MDKKNMMNCAHLFNGISGFGLAAHWMGWTNYMHCEIDPFCNKVMNHHFPNSIQHEDIRTTDFTTYRGTIDLLTGGFPCFTGDTLVKTIAGYKRIDEVRITDFVLTHTGTYKPVTYLMNKQDAEIWKLKAQGLYKSIQTTGEHPFLVRKTKNNQQEWMEVRRIRKGFFIGYRCTEGQLDVQDGSFWYVVGRYLGDGWIQNQIRKSKIQQGQRGSRVNSKNWKVIICTAKEDKENLLKAIKKAGFSPTVSEERTTVKFIINSKSLVQFLESFGKYAYGKTLPGWCSQLTIDRQKALFEGWMDADGYKAPDGAFKVTTVSESLVMSMAEIARNVYKCPVSISKKTAKRICIIEGRHVNEKPQFCLTVSNSNRYGFYKDGHVWCLVKKIRKTDEFQTVYNISVDEDETYTAAGITVHNCQPYSTAGKRKGKDDERHLWPEMLRAIREIQPGWVVGENVRGLTNWNGGLVFDEVRADLEAEGYQVLPFLLPAAGVGAPHRRDRIWFIAYANSFGHQGWGATSDGQQHDEGRKTWGKSSSFGLCRTIANTSCERCGKAGQCICRSEERDNRDGDERIATDTSSAGLSVGLQSSEYRIDQTTGEQQGCKSARIFPTPDWQEFPTQSPVCNRNDGLSGRLVNITFSKWRRESIKALGNAIVPQVAYQIFKAIEQYNQIAGVGKMVE